MGGWSDKILQDWNFGLLISNSYQLVLLPFADDAVLLVSSNGDLQLELGRFAAECQAVGMTISMSQAQAMLLSWKGVDCKLRVSEQTNDSAEIIKKKVFCKYSNGAFPVYYKLKKPTGPRAVGCSIA